MTKRLASSINVEDQQDLKKPNHNSCDLISQQEKVLKFHHAEMRVIMDDQAPHHFFGAEGIGNRMHRHVRRHISKYSVEKGTVNLRVYYHQRRFSQIKSEAAQQIERLLTDTPQTADQLDYFFECQNGSIIQSSPLNPCTAKNTLISLKERLQSRSKVVVSTSRAFAYPSYGGESTWEFPAKLKKKEGNNIPVVILSAPMIQLYHPGLDRPLLWDDDIGVKWDSLVKALAEDVQLWFEALYRYAKEFQYGVIHCRVPPVGGEPLAKEHYYIDLYQSQMNNALLDAILIVLNSTRYTQVLAKDIKWRLDFVHFKCHPSYPDTYPHNLRTVNTECNFLTNTSIIHPLSDEQLRERHGKVMFCVISPTNANHQPGGDAESRSVETMLASVSSIRMDQCYQFNAEVLNHTNYVPI